MGEIREFDRKLGEIREFDCKPGEVRGINSEWGKSVISIGNREESGEVRASDLIWGKSRNVIKNGDTSGISIENREKSETPIESLKKSGNSIENREKSGIIRDLTVSRLVLLANAESVSTIAPFQSFNQLLRAIPPNAMVIERAKSSKRTQLVVFRWPFVCLGTLLFWLFT